MKHSALAVLAISAMLTGTGNAQPSETGLPPALIVADSGTSVRVAGLVATWYPPTTGRRGPAILALGGSEGGEAGSKYLARQLNKHGYGVLALAYFQADGLPQLVQELPLEYFDRAIAWMKSQPQVDPSSMGIYGISVGAETALVVAARHPELKAVVAGVPSSVVWQGINPSDWAHPRSS